MRRRVWVLDTETKGTGAEMVPLDTVLKKPEPRRDPLFVPPKPKPPEPKPAEPRQPRRLRALAAVDARGAARALGPPRELSLRRLRDDPRLRAPEPEAGRRAPAAGAQPPDHRRDAA